MQAFFNKSLLQVLSHIITPYAATEAADEEEELLASAKQAMSAVPPMPSARSRGLRGVPGAGALPKRLPKYVENKHVVQMRVPKPYVDREYRVRRYMPLCVGLARDMCSLGHCCLMPPSRCAPRNLSRCCGWSWC